MNGISQCMLHWNGTNVGPIEMYIDFPSVVVNNKTKRILNLTNNKTPLKLNIKNETLSSDFEDNQISVKFTKLRNMIPLISDNVKFIYGMPYIGLHTCSIEGDSYLMINNQNITLLNDYMKNKDIDDLPDIFIEEIRKIFVYKWLMCITKNTENNIMVRKFTFPEDKKFKPKYDLVYPISYNEMDIDETPDLSKSKISNAIIKKWFNDDENLVEEVKYQLLNNKTSKDVKLAMEKMAKKYKKDSASFMDDFHLGDWIDSVCYRIDSL
jgi:hypothetical protein